MEHFGELNVRLRRLGIFQVKFDCATKIKIIITRCGLCIICISYILAPAWYFLFESKTPIEQAESEVFVLMSMTMLLWYSVFLFQSKKYATLLDELSAIITKSK